MDSVKDNVHGTPCLFAIAYLRYHNSKDVCQGVTLGGTGKEIGDRHPKVGDGALIGACVIILGNIKIGEGAMIAAGSLVLKDVPPHR
jgi:serine O-acetyltransferase